MKRKELFKSFKLIFLYLILNIFLGGLNTSLNIKDENILMIITILESLLIMFIFIFGFRKKLKGQLGNFKSNFKSFIKISFKYWLIGFVLMIISNLIINTLILDGIAPNEEANRIVLMQYPIYSILSMCIITPIVEELLFRLNFKEVFKKKWIFVVITGFIFGFMHVILSLSNLSDLLYLIPYSSLGLAFGLIYYETNNICSSIMMHMFHNSLTILIIFLGI